MFRVILANIVACGHLIFILLFLGSLIFAIFVRKAWALALPVSLYISMFASQLLFCTCPLTALEKGLRGDAAYTGPFITHYLQEWFGIGVPESVFAMMFSIFLFFFGACLVIGWLIRRKSKNTS